jgi:hypothetical protein
MKGEKLCREESEIFLVERRKNVQEGSCFLFVEKRKIREGEEIFVGYLKLGVWMIFLKFENVNDKEVLDVYEIGFWSLIALNVNEFSDIFKRFEMHF